MINQRPLLCAPGGQPGPEVLHQADQGRDPGAWKDAKPVHVHQEGNRGNPDWIHTNKKVPFSVEGTIPVWMAIKPSS